LISNTHARRQISVEGFALLYLISGDRRINNRRIWRGLVVATGALSRDPCGLDGLPPQDKRRARAKVPFRPGLRPADRLAQAGLYPARGPGLRHNRCYGIPWPRDRRKYDREPEYGATQERHRRDLGETIRIRVKRRLIELGRARCINPKWIFSPFAHYSSRPWQRLLYHRIIFRAVTPRIAGILKLKGECLTSVWHALGRRRILCGIRERFPIAWSHVIEKGSLNINKLRQVPIEKVCQLFRGLP
jgi:hypothetical protein